MSPTKAAAEVDARRPAFDPDDPAVVARWQRTVSGLYDRRNEAAVRRVIERDILEPGPDPDVHRRVHSQPEHAWALEHYLSKIVSRERILAGKARLPEIASQFETAGTAAPAVPAHVLAAIWGIETRYGEHLGHFNAARSLTTLAVVDVRRPALWAEELERLLDLIASGTFADDAVTGSWCGALGHTQFMPRTLSTFGIDADGDGRVDVIASPRDALASAANYLTARGWSGGLPPLLEVRAQPTFDWADWELADERPLADWRSRGLSPSADVPAGADAMSWRLIAPEGHTGFLALVNMNYRALLGYNPAQSYAISVSLLARAMAEDRERDADWPASPEALTKGEIIRLQIALHAEGLDTGGLDGICGAETRKSVKAAQKQHGLVPDGFPTLALLQAVIPGR